MTPSPPPYRHRSGPLRLLDRHRRLVASLLTALAVLCAVLVLRPPPEPVTRVLAAARDLDASAPLSEDDLVPLALAGRAAPDGALSPGDRAAGMSLNAPVRRGEVLTDARLSDPPALPYGADMVAVPVRVADPGMVGLLSPGRRVDVLAAAGAAGADPFGGPTARSGPAVEVVGDRPVLAVPDEEGGGGEGGALVVIAATREEARALAGHAPSSRLSVTIRG
ncbi:Flp pilus assembly protein CpaB [Nocardiopsis sp. NPDC006938]|uniref:Flp pilus assembly protein CpaB n=1 Tax=Nocardiopsis sp. NPDC006938 TaxID=3364337 RepID=UPI003675543A